MKLHDLTLKWTISRGKETYGWNICTLYDGNKKYSTNGGGYDMQGTVFAMWLWDNFQDQIKAELRPYNTKYNEGEFYGFFNYAGCGYVLDGGCGLDSMIKIAKAIGLQVHKAYYKNEILKFIVIEEN